MDQFKIRGSSVARLLRGPERDRLAIRVYVTRTLCPCFYLAFYHIVNKTVILFPFLSSASPITFCFLIMRQAKLLCLVSPIFRSFMYALTCHYDVTSNFIVLINILISAPYNLTECNEFNYFIRSVSLSNKSFSYRTLFSVRIQIRGPSL